ncbi:hypothetical protein N7478_007430 [Penicillium angulare]|uniref:uncharacterized protein n=1 Tax=Penicillium angulare TaxID=116970 RepID=UPI00253F972B|nr:uncharacterized protein N7478_007430 [Penicillium angulare]KAJ5272305.1 hypothetical protein N7478_007430 [Penicillium angulare]
MDEQDIFFASFGLVVLDEIRFPGRAPLTNILGGSGAYATLGALLFLPSPKSRRVAWRIHTGNDFPESIEELLQSWDITLHIDEKLERLSARGLLEYKDTTFGRKDSLLEPWNTTFATLNERRSLLKHSTAKTFQYTTPILVVDELSIGETALLKSNVYHYLASPQDIKIRVTNLLALRHKAGILDRPLIIWEPAPLSCSPDNLQACFDAARYVDVLSPNHLELLRLFSRAEQTDLTITKIEELATKLVDNGVGPDNRGIVLIRAGEKGCLVQARYLPATWLPPFYRDELEAGSKELSVSKVVDPTGAGNAFLGGYAVGYLRTNDALRAACYGAVAASIALEQIGMPERVEKGDTELWNGVSVEARLQEYMSRKDVERSTR